MPLPLFRRIILPCLALACFAAGSSKPPIAIRFFLETNRNDTASFASPIELHNPPRSSYIEKMSSISESDIAGIYPFQAADATWGCLFKLSESGKRNLEMISAEQRGHSIVAFVGTKKGTRQVIDMIIDRRISDGFITIQSGLTEDEMTLLRKNFRTIKPPHEARIAPRQSQRIA
jgi:hypothetical protein